MEKYEEKCSRVREQVRQELSEDEFEEYSKILRVRTDKEDEMVFKSASRKRERTRHEATSRKPLEDHSHVKRCKHGIPILSPEPHSD